MDKGFRRIVFTIMLLTTVTVLSVGIYLWYNFNARSRLVLVIPASSQWFLHVQTKQIRADFANYPNEPSGIARLRATIKNLPIFKGMQDPTVPGIGLFSDVVAFGLQTNVEGRNYAGNFMSLSLTSEEKFKKFLSELVQKGKLHRLIDKNKYSYAKFTNANAFVVYKYKAMMIFVPGDTIENMVANEKILDVVFASKPHEMMQNPTVQTLYKGEPDVVFYSASPKYGFSQSMDFPEMIGGSNVALSNGQSKIVKANDQMVKFSYPNQMKDAASSPSPLMMFFKCGLNVSVEHSLNLQNQLAADEALSLLADALNFHILKITLK